MLHRTHNGYIVVVLEEAERLPRLNAPVYTRDAKRVGVLLDIIGPVKSPYAVVKPDKRDIELPAETVLYYRKPLPPRSRRRGKSRGPPRGRGRRS